MLSGRRMCMRVVVPLLTPMLPSASHRTLWLHGRRRLCCSVSNAEQNESSCVDVEARVSVVVRELCAHGMTWHPQKKVTSLYQLLLGLGIKAETIEAQLLEMPELLNYSHKAWTDTCEAMAENGMPSLHILQTIALQPKLLKVKPSLLHKKLFQYRQMTIGKLSVLSLVMKHPLLLFTEPARVIGRLENLHTMFPQKELKSLVRNNPKVLTDGWEDIMAKIMYIHKEMGLEQPHIADSKCLSHTLLHLKARHLFLLRAGLYKTPKLQKDKLSYRRNSSLSDIMDTSSKYFANRVARLTEQEYEVFKAMVAAEELGDSDSDYQDADYTDDESDHQDADYTDDKDSACGNKKH